MLRTGEPSGQIDDSQGLEFFEPRTNNFDGLWEGLKSSLGNAQMQVDHGEVSRMRLLRAGASPMPRS